MRLDRPFRTPQLSSLVQIAAIWLLAMFGRARAADRPFDVIVSAESTSVMSGERRIGEVKKGTRLTASQINGDWYLVAVPGANPPQEGWIRKSDVERASANIAAPARSEDQQARLKQRDLLWTYSQNLHQAGKLDEAIAAAKEMLDIELAVVGSETPDAISSMSYLADLRCEKEDFSAARKLREAALANCTKLLGKDHWRTIEARLALEKTSMLQQLGVDDRHKLSEAYRLSVEARQLSASGKFSLAISSADRSADMYRGVLGSKHPDYATTLADLASLNFKAANYAKAVSLFRQALDIDKEVRGEWHPYYATELDNLALVYDELGHYAVAQPLYEQALAIRKQTLGEHDPDYAAGLANLGGFYCNIAEFGKAERLCQESLAIRKESLGEEHPDYAASLVGLSRVHRQTADYTVALAELRQALAIDGKALGETSADYASLLYDMAMLRQEMGDYSQAERFCRQALETRKKLFGENHPDYARSLNSLALLYEAMGDYSKAEPLFQQASKIDKDAIGESSPAYATDLNNLGNLYYKLGQYTKALALYRQSVEIRAQVLGKKDLNYAASLGNVALLFQRNGDFANAEMFFREVLTIQQQLLGEDNLACVTTLGNLGLLYETLGDYGRAEPFLKKALQIDKDVLGDKSLDYAIQLSNLAGHYSDTGDRLNAERLSLQAFEIVRAQLDLTAGVQSERQQLRMADTLRAFLDGYLSNSERAVASSERAYAELLAWKGTVSARQQAMRGMRQALRKGLPSDVAELFDKLNAASRDLANQSRIVPRSGTEAEYLQKQAELSDSIERLQRELAAKSDEFRKHRQQEHRTPDEIRRALPSDAALVDFLEYDHVAPSEEKGKGPSFERRLVAFVVRPDKPVERIELGPAATIADFIEQWRRNYGSASAAANADPGQELRQRVWEELAPSLAGIKTILISPDGATARFPWAALPGKMQGTYLIEERAIAVVPVPRLLPELITDNKSGQIDVASLLLVGGVDFGADPGRIVDVAFDRGAARGDQPQYWPPLPGTVAEVAAVKAAFAQRFGGVAPLELTGAAATKTAVRDEMGKYRYLHFSTHGFFAAPKVKSATALDPRLDSTAVGGLLTRQDVSGYHPDLLSGLVLAGANRQVAEGKEDGILTALEVSGLDLSQVELATLSACETGLGESAGGEGLLGLQRAFQLAGAKTTVSSLWQVPDKATQSLMQRFYYNLWNPDRKISKLEALREAQIWLLNNAARHPELIRGLELEAIPGGDVHAGRLSPRYWAAFELSGDWR